MFVVAYLYRFAVKKSKSTSEMWKSRQSVRDLRRIGSQWPISPAVASPKSAVHMCQNQNFLNPMLETVKLSAVSIEEFSIARSSVKSSPTVMLCAISGEVPQVPVASRKSGAVYEKRLITAYITENGTEPVSGEDLTTEDLIDLKTSRIVRPRPPTLTSIPSLLSVFQEEWDSLALEAYTVRENLVKTRQELSTALYQHDAAVRVIARLTKERDEAREALSKINISGNGSTANGEAMQVDSVPLPNAVIVKIEETQERLSKTRRKRPVPEDWATPDDISSYTRQKTSKPLYPGGRTLAVHQDGDLVLVGGSDGVAGVYSLSQDRVGQAFKGGEGAITAGGWSGSKAIISTSAGRVKCFEGGTELANFSVHTGEASDLAVHPCGDIVASVGSDKSYVLYDLESKSVLTQGYTDSELSCIAFHPDGHLFAAGGHDGEIKIFDVKSLTQVATFSNGASTPIKALFFSENGTWLASVRQDSTSVSIWDLRKTAEIRSLDIEGPVDAIAWDYTGQFLVATGPAGTAVEKYDKASKEWSEAVRNSIPAVQVAWGQAARGIVLLGSDGAVSVLA